MARRSSEGNVEGDSRSRASHTTRLGPLPSRYSAKFAVDDFDDDIREQANIDRGEGTYWGTEKRQQDNCPRKGGSDPNVYRDQRALALPLGHLANLVVTLKPTGCEPVPSPPEQTMTRYKGRQSAKAVEQDFPHFVDMAVPPGGLGKRLPPCTNSTLATASSHSVVMVGMMRTAPLFGGTSLTRKSLRILRASSEAPLLSVNGSRRRINGTAMSN
jgi:hypothetical protein